MADRRYVRFFCASLCLEVDELGVFSVCRLIIYNIVSRGEKVGGKTVDQNWDDASKLTISYKRFLLQAVEAACIGGEGV